MCYSVRSTSQSLNMYTASIVLFKYIQRSPGKENGTQYHDKKFQQTGNKAHDQYSFSQVHFWLGM